MADAGHVLGAVAAPEARLVLLELDIEHPVQTVFDCPVGARRCGEGLGCQDTRRDIATPFGFYLAAGLDAGLDHGDGFKALEARLIGITALAAHPAGVLRDEVAARFDAAMGFFGLGQNVNLMGGGAVEIQLDFGMGGFLIVLGGQKIVAAEIDDLLRKCPTDSPWRRC